MNFIESLLLEGEGGEREMVRAKLRVAVTEGLLLSMRDVGMTKNDLAQRIGISRSAVTQALASSRNLSLNTLADMAHAIGLRTEVTFTPLAQPRVSAGAPVLAKPHAIQAAYPIFTSGNEHVAFTS